MLDATRLITAALNHYERRAPNTIALTDPLAESLDVVGLNAQTMLVDYVRVYQRSEPAKKEPAKP
jgi:hypothetical protein